MNQYHSFSAPDHDYKPEAYFKMPQGHIGHVLDIAKDPIPDFWSKADCIYSEIAWRAGYPVFQERAGKNDSVHADYKAGIKRVIETLRVPTFLIGSVLDMRALDCEAVLKIRFKTPARNDIAYLGIWNIESGPMFEDHVEVLEYIKTGYKTVLDFSCGYLSIAETLLPECTIIASDINPKCVGGAHETLKEYYGRANA